MTSTKFDANWQFLIRTRQNAIWRSFENTLSQELEDAFCTPGLARIRLASTVIGTDSNDVSFIIDFHQMEVRLFATYEVGIIRRNTATCIAPPGEVWEYEESDGDWKSYDLASCELLRIARGSGRTSTVVYSLDERETYSYEIYFELEQHVNRSTNKWHNIRLNTGSQLFPTEPAEELSQLDTEEVDNSSDNVELASQGNVVDGMEVNIQRVMKQSVEMRHMDGKKSVMEDESHLDDSLLAQRPNLLMQMELKSGDIKKVQNTPIGTGGYSKVYEVKYNGETMVAKVISDSEIMEKLYELTGGALWTKNKDRLSWQLNSCTSEFREADGRITCIDLTFNNLIGMIPQELGRLLYLTTLNLSCNKLKGAIPVELRELKNLVHLYLDHNQLTGEIPNELGELKNLEHLYLCDNELTGKIPKELGKLSRLEKLWLYGNQLTGEIPKELGKLLNLVHLYLDNNQLTGEIPKELGELKNLMGLGIHVNQLTGEIPKELGELKKLVGLCLYGNQLAGGPPVIPGCYLKFYPQRL